MIALCQEGERNIVQPLFDDLPDDLNQKFRCLREIFSSLPTFLIVVFQGVGMVEAS